MVTESAAIEAEAPVAEAPVAEVPVAEAPVAEVPVAEASVAEADAGVLAEVGKIEPEAALNGTAPLVAYVPSLEDTQPIPAYAAPEAEPAPVVAEEPVSQPAPEEPPAVAPMASAAAASAAATHYFIASQPVAELAQPSPVEGFAAELTEPQAEDPREVAVETSASFEPAPPAGDVDVAVAEEFAQRLAEQEAAVVATVIEAEQSPSDATEAGSETIRLSEAVSRAFDKLRPQLIAEILKEIKK
jgi:hypothetical protein